MTLDTLLLNADYRPLKVLSWQRALSLVMEEHAYTLADYPARQIRSPSVSFPWPAVVVLKRYSQNRARIKLSRRNILARDGYRCAYCGDAPRTVHGKVVLEALTIDHVIPRARSRHARVRLPNGQVVGVTSWENVVAACVGCNGMKADRTPAEAGLTLRFTPARPTHLDALRMAITRVHIPDEWKAYLPPDSEWRTYWTVGLEP
jgi:5-methylcytosine-specific restriction endonuclease McrA